MACSTESLANLPLICWELKRRIGTIVRLSNNYITPNTECKCAKKRKNSWIDSGYLGGYRVTTIAVLPFAPSDCQCTFAEFHSPMPAYRPPFALLALWPT